MRILPKKWATHFDYGARNRFWDVLKAAAIDRNPVESLFTPRQQSRRGWALYGTKW
jgi:hypothetical protein